jgi:hypothetical protein
VFQSLLNFILYCSDFLRYYLTVVVRRRTQHDRSWSTITPPAFAPQTTPQDIVIPMILVTANSERQLTIILLLFVLLQRAGCPCQRSYDFVGILNFGDLRRANVSVLPKHFSNYNPHTTILWAHSMARSSPSWSHFFSLVLDSEIHWPAVMHGLWWGCEVAVKSPIDLD